MLSVIIGAQWGDEGKGKVVDLLAEEAQVVARCQGGPNAGHTVVIGRDTFVLHLVPTGALHPGTLCLLGSGVVIDPAAFFAEIEGLEARGLEVTSRLRVDPRAHIIMPYHRSCERAEEGRVAGGRLGTTLRGIGPAYASKAARTGVRVVDLLDRDRLRSLIEYNLESLGPRLGAPLSGEEMGTEVLCDLYGGFGARLRPLIADVSQSIIEALDAGRRVLVEGAQGTFLDLDQGTYPYVTSSSTIAGGALTGLGIGPRFVDRVIGVAKAYTTRVGNGPFPTEIEPEGAANLREAGGEYGATTGRPRRCGWLDLPALRRAARISGFDALAVTKLDVLDSLETIPVCVAYEADPRGDWWPEVELETARPIYRNLRGWRAPTGRARSLDELPPLAREYLNVISSETGVPVTMVSVGSERDETVHIADPFGATAVSR